MVEKKSCKIGIVFNSPSEMRKSSIDYGKYYKGFKSIGLNCILFARKESVIGFDYPIETVDNETVFCREDYWKRFDLDYCLIPTWMGMNPILASLKKTNCRILNMIDSDGYFGTRVFPRYSLKNMVSYHNDWHSKIKCLYWWIRIYLFYHKVYAESVIDNFKLSDKIIVNSPQARRNIIDFLRYYNSSDLSSKIITSKYPVHEIFLSQATVPKLNQIISIGRWESGQKNGALLKRVIKRFLSLKFNYRFVIVGTCQDNFFADLLRDFPNCVTHIPSASREEIYNLIRSSKILLSTSIYESGPIVADEALLSGTSLVAPLDIPLFNYYLSDNHFGTGFKARKVKSVVRALSQEIHRWEFGERNNLMGLSNLKSLNKLENICQKIVDGLDLLPETLSEMN